MDEPVKEVAVAFTRRIPQFEHNCPVCSTTFQGAKIKVYCSEKCRKAAAWDRNGDKYNAGRKNGAGKA